MVLYPEAAISSKLGVGRYSGIKIEKYSTAAVQDVSFGLFASIDVVAFSKVKSKLIQLLLKYDTLL